MEGQIWFVHFPKCQEELAEAEQFILQQANKQREGMPVDFLFPVLHLGTSLWDDAAQSG